MYPKRTMLMHKLFCICCKIGSKSVAFFLHSNYRTYRYIQNKVGLFVSLSVKEAACINSAVTYLFGNIHSNMTSVLGYTKLDVPCNTDNQRTKHFVLFCKSAELGLIKNLGTILVIKAFKIEVTKKSF